MSRNTETKDQLVALMVPNSEGRGLSITPAGRLISLVRSSISLANGRALLSLLREDPDTLETGMALVYQRPELLNERVHQTPTLTEIRIDFPTVITAFTNDQLSQLMEKFTTAHPEYPDLKAMIWAEKDMLFRAGVREEVADIELSLKILIEDGNSGLLNSEDYRQTITDLEFYGDLRDYLDERGLRLSFQEEEKLIQIGQRLLLKKREYEFQAQDITPKTEDEAFERELAQLKLVFRVNGLRLEGGFYRVIIKDDSIKSLATMLARWPTKAMELRELFGNLLETKDWEHWAPPPPGALTDRDELADVMGTA